ncbi:MAG: hypothetical protein PHV98_00730 [Candidatus Omnitrophica bacterium]|nr:hypothetical protein [Candidatus Omnitrophota bacterium]
MADKITLAQMINAVETTLSAAASIKNSQSYNQLTEGMNDLPCLQVYPEAANQDAQYSTDRTTFKGGCRQTSVTIFADYFARQRSHLGEDMVQLVTGIDEITDIFEAQDTQPYFGLVGIKNFHWSWQRVVFTYADESIKYMGARFMIVLRVY